MKVLGEVFLVFGSFVTLTLAMGGTRTNESVVLSTLEPQPILVTNNLTDFVVEIDPGFQCGPGYECYITVEIREMTCYMQEFDLYPSYVYFIPLKATGRTDEDLARVKEWACEMFEKRAWHGLEFLKDFDLTAVFIQPVGIRWNIDAATVELFVKIVQTKVTPYILDRASQAVQLEVSGRSEILVKLDGYCGAAEENCPYSIFTQLKYLSLELNSALKITTFYQNQTEIGSLVFSKSTFVPLEGLEFTPGVASVLFSPLGKWEESKALVTSSVHFVPQKGEACPEDYFDCGSCGTGHVLVDSQVTSCIPRNLMCDTSAHCGLPCYADESATVCGQGTDKDHRYIQQYINDLHDLYIFLVELFLWTSALTLIIVLAIALLFSYKMDMLRQAFELKSVLRSRPPTFEVGPDTSYGTGKLRLY